MSRPASPAQLCALNAGIQVVWGAILAVSLQERSSALGHGDGVRAYATIAASGALVATLTQLAAGPLSDRARRSSGNRFAFYIAGVAGAVPALFWFYLAPNFGQLVGAFLTLELVLNVAGGPYQAVIPDYVPLARRGIASSWMAAYQSIGNAAGLLVAGFVHDLRFVALALAGALVATYAVTAAHLRRLARGGPATESAVEPPTSDIAGPKAGTVVATIDDGYAADDGNIVRAAATAAAGTPGPRAALGALLVSRGLINLGFFTLLGFLLFFVRDALGVRDATTQTALLFLAFTLAAVAGAAIAARPTDRYDKRLVVTIAIATVAGSLCVLAASTSLPVAYVAATLAGAAWGAFVTADWALASAVLPAGAMATAMGVWNVATALPQVVAPLVAAPLVSALNAQHHGAGLRGAIVLAIVEFVAGGAAVWRLPRV